MINDTYRCRYLVGAGGTHCPVYRTFFRQLNPRLQESQIVALEDEYIGTINETGCHLWFWEGKLPGYSWYVPKGNGYINVGIGGKSAVLRSRGETIQHHWAQFARTHLGGPPIGRERRTPAGYVYHLRSGVPVVRTGNAFVVGDAAGLGTRDMGEGIGPAVQSGIRAADAIIRRTEYSVRSIRKYSFRELLFPGRKGEGSGAGG
jgi:flavin-dependent dehydrogenase